MLLLLCDIMPVMPVVAAAVVYLLSGSALEDDTWEEAVDCNCEGRLDGLDCRDADFISNCNSSHLTFSNAACLRSELGLDKFD